MLLNYLFESFSLMTQTLPIVVVDVAMGPIAAQAANSLTQFMFLLFQIPPFVDCIFYP